MTSFLRTTESYVHGARTLPGRYYTSTEILAEERERIFADSWLVVGRASEIAEPGSFITREIDNESVMVLRDRTNVVRAFLNICRHRGTRICGDARGTLRETIQCPYHAWTYALDGRLIGAPHMHEVAEFDKRDYPLHKVAVAEWEGFLLLNLSRTATPFAESYAALLGRFSRYNLSELTVIRRIEYDVAANWKLILQNYNECLHCPTIHPELSRVLPYQSGENDLVEGPFLGGFMEILAPNESATITGRACGLPLGALSDEDMHRAYYYSFFPSAMLSIHPDYAVYYMVSPLTASTSRVVSEWLVSPAAVARADFDPSGAIEFWDVTNRQDWHICEMSHAGISSRAYVPGPYSPRESIPAAWDREYLRRMGHG